MPQIAKLAKPKDNISAEDLYTIGKNLVKYFPQDRINEKDDFENDVFYYGISQPSKQMELIRTEIDLRFTAINNKIKKYGKRVFILTAISQNSRFDTISVLILNFRMINDLIKSTGYRPSYYQLFKIYWRVMITGAFAYATSEVVELADDDFLQEIGPEIGATIGLSFGNMLGKAFKSIADGAVNGLLTLRLGFITKKYLEEGFKMFENKTDRVRIYRASLKQALNLKKDIFNQIKLAS